MNLQQDHWHTSFVEAFVQVFTEFASYRCCQHWIFSAQGCKDIAAHRICQQGGKAARPGMDAISLSLTALTKRLLLTDFTGKSFRSAHDLLGKGPCRQRPVCFKVFGSSGLGQLDVYGIQDQKNCGLSRIQDSKLCASDKGSSVGM